MTTPNTKAVHKHPRGNDLVLSIVLEEASRVVRLLSPNAEEGESKGIIIEETRAQLLDPSSVKNLQVLLFRQGCKHHITTPAPRIEGGAIVLEIPAEVQQIGTYYVEISYDHEAPQLSDGHMRVTTHAPAVQIVPTSDAPTALDVVVSAHVLPLLQGGQGGASIYDQKDAIKEMMREEFAGASETAALRRVFGNVETRLYEFKDKQDERLDAIQQEVRGQVENLESEIRYKLNEALANAGAGSGVSPEALDEIREEITDTKTYIQALKGRWTLDFISQFFQVTDNPDEDAERMATYAHSLKEMVDALNQYPPIENVDPEALTPGGQLLYLKNDVEQLKGLLEATREDLQALKEQAGGNQGGISPEAIADLKDRTDKLERMISNPRVYKDDLNFYTEDDAKDLSQGEQDLLMASLKRTILAPWLATEEVWGKWWVYERTSSIKKLTIPTKEFNADKPWRDTDYRFQAYNGGMLVGNFYTLEQAMASMTYPMGDLRIYVYGTSTPHAIFDPIPADAYKVQHGHIELDYGTATLSIVEGDYELIKETPDFQF